MSIPIPFFYIAAAAFALFSLVYGVIGAAIIYHLRVHSVSGRLAPYITTIVFVAVSIALWLFALIFLLRFPH